MTSQSTLSRAVKPADLSMMETIPMELMLVGF